MPEERQALAECSVFRGTFDLDAAEAIVTGDPLGADAMDLIGGLCDKSLLRQVYIPDQGVRFALFKSIRAYATLVRERASLRSLMSLSIPK